MQRRVAHLNTFRPVLVVSLLTASLVLVACGGGKDEKKAAGQTVARVNKEELTVHQINFVLSQQRGLRPEQTDAASRQVLERLIDQELAIQKATEQKLDRDARVVAQLEAARRDIISRAYFERVGEAAPKPAPEDIKKYYDENPALFAQRRVYQLQEIAIEATPDKVDALNAALKSAKTAADFVQYLRTNNFKFNGNQAVRGAEQIPMALLATLSKMKDGESLFNATPTGATVLVLAGSRAQPVDEATARPAIEQFLVNDRKRRLVADDVKALRAAADIKYLGKFAEGPKGGAAPAATASPADVAASAVQAGAAAPAAAVVAPSPAAAASSGLDAGTITKGLGLK
ncbi:MAG: EpsD family peptidyl-prolyl cis-trans isomerase [Rubrivivax sp.]|nr:EpsD family peptidyl-prolyl cis-trans isomerase [Rubrivivax sp.]